MNLRFDNLFIVNHYAGSFSELVLTSRLWLVRDFKALNFQIGN